MSILMNGSWPNGPPFTAVGICRTSKQDVRDATWNENLQLANALRSSQKTSRRDFYFGHQVGVPSAVPTFSLFLQLLLGSMSQGLRCPPAPLKYHPWVWNPLGTTLGSHEDPGMKSMPSIIVTFLDNQVDGGCSDDQLTHVVYAPL